jgi:hypothetical protein
MNIRPTIEVKVRHAYLYSGGGDGRPDPPIINDLPFWPTRNRLRSGNPEGPRGLLSPGRPCVRFPPRRTAPGPRTRTKPRCSERLCDAPQSRARVRPAVPPKPARRRPAMSGNLLRTPHISANRSMGRSCEVSGAGSRCMPRACLMASVGKQLLVKSLISVVSPTGFEPVTH